jgi:hypothetical protein
MDIEAGFLLDNTAPSAQGKQHKRGRGEWLDLRLFNPDRSRGYASLPLFVGKQFAAYGLVYQLFTPRTHPDFAPSPRQDWLHLAQQLLSTRAHALRHPPFRNRLLRHRQALASPTPTPAYWCRTGLAAHKP